MNTPGKFFVIATAFIASLFIAGCNAVTIWQPLSAEPKPIDKDKFEGTWHIDGSGVLNIMFGDDGIGRIAAVEWKDGEFRLQQGEMIVTEGAKFNFLSFRVLEEGQWTPYNLAQYRFTPQGDLLVWQPEIKAFEDAVAQNRLKGLVEKHQHSARIMLTSEPAEILKFIDDPDTLTLFDYRNPIVIKKLAGAE